MADFKNPNYFPPDYQQLYIGWESDGEWTSYTVDVKSAGRYRIQVLYSNKANTLQLDLNGRSADQCKLPFDTGYWHTWNKADCGEIEFPEKGKQLLTLHYNTGNNLACIDFVPVEENPGEHGWGMKGFVTRQGDQLMEDSKPFRFVALDVPNIFQTETQLMPDYRNRFPDAYEMHDYLASLQQMGATASRAFALSIATEKDKPLPVFINALGQYNEDAFRSLDLLLALCHQYNVRLIIPFIDSHSFKGVRGFDEFAAFRGKTGPEFLTDPQLRQDFHELLSYVLNRRNTVSGLLYKDDPAILAWQAANEPMSYFPDRGEPQNEKAITDWTLDTAEFVKSIDHNHLFISSGGTDARFLASDAVDILNGHYYQFWGKYVGGSGDIVAPLLHDSELSRGKKPFVADESGMSDTPLLAAFLAAAEQNQLSGVLVWSLRPHRRDGGFYYHNESGSVYNAYHWPGFAAGDGYDEKAVIKLVRDAAFHVRDLPVPAIAPPHYAPLLFPVSPLRELTWRGSTDLMVTTFSELPRTTGRGSQLLRMSRMSSSMQPRSSVLKTSGKLRRLRPIPHFGAIPLLKAPGLSTTVSPGAIVADVHPGPTSPNSSRRPP